MFPHNRLAFLFAFILGDGEFTDLVSSWAIESIACWTRETAFTVACVTRFAFCGGLWIWNTLSTTLTWVRVTIIFRHARFIPHTRPDTVALDDFVETFVTETAITVLTETVWMSPGVVRGKEGTRSLISGQAGLPRYAFTITTMLMIAHWVNGTDFRFDLDF